jgi:hypothetical protein
MNSSVLPAEQDATRRIGHIRRCGALHAKHSGCILRAGNSLEWPVGIRHHGEPSSRAGNAHAAKTLEETMEQTAEAVCKICFGANWEKRYTAGLNRVRHRESPP